MKRRNWIVLAWFFGSMTAFVVGWAVIDGVIGYTWGSAATVSYSVALMARQWPFLWGMACWFAGAIPIGLIVHFVNPMTQPDTQAELDRLTAENAHLRGQLSKINV